MIQDVFEFSSSTAGPKLVVSILMHGDEICGLTALQAALDETFALLRGQLRIIVMNRAAHEARGGAVRHLGNDMNRCWSKAALAEHSVEGQRIESVLRYLEDADAILDIHSMPEQDTPFLLVSETRRGSATLAARLGPTVPRTVIAPPPKMRGEALFETTLLAKDKPIVVVECGRHQSAQSPEIAHATFLQFLSVHDMIAPPETSNRGPVEFFEVCDEIKLSEGPLKLDRPMLGFDRLAAGDTYGWDGVRPLIAEEDCRVLLTRPAEKPGDEALTLVRPIPKNQL